MHCLVMAVLMKNTTSRAQVTHLFNINRAHHLTQPQVSQSHLDGFDCFLSAAISGRPGQVEVRDCSRGEAAHQEEHKTGDVHLCIHNGEQENDEEVGHPDGSRAYRDSQRPRALLEHLWKREKGFTAKSFSWHICINGNIKSHITGI